ncbi:MAG: Gfo/Idh/MocA family oxidoreductase [Armatimonadota bacterium]|nr:MAG: Gfo/Idh/MocA family oxidoreductase [Armatimonadota bacterium]
MIRACVIGLTAAGGAHAAAYRGDTRSQLVGVCDTETQRAEELAARLKAPAFRDLDEMLATARPDLVSVCTRGDRIALVRQVLEAGCHVLCEAPLSREPTPAREVVALARARGLCLAADFNLRFTPAVVTAKRWIDDGRVGTPLFINTSLWWSCAGKSGDPPLLLWRIACHGFDLMRYLCGGIAQAQCFATQASQGGSWSSAQMNVRFASDIVGGLTVSTDMAARHPLARCEVAGTTARVVVDNIYEEVALYPHAEEDKTVITNSIFGGLGGYEDTYRCRVERLLEQLAASAGPDEIEGSGADALAAQASVDAAVASLESGEIAPVTAV